MRLEVIPVLQKMKELYESSRNRERFDAYLFMLQGADGNDMMLPIASYNPMGKELALQKVNELIEHDAEAILRDVIERTNAMSIAGDTGNRTIGVAINLADDVEGSWSEKDRTDYNSKFKIDALLKRNFCTPIFWTSESANREVIERRSEEYLYRTQYWLEHGAPSTLADMVEQEIAVQGHFSDDSTELSGKEVEKLEAFLDQHGDSEEMVMHLNFFYGGNDGAHDMPYPDPTLPRNGGYAYTKYKASKRVSR